MAWTYLFLASILEIGWAVGLKYTDGFTVLLPSVLVAMGITLTFVMLTRAVREIPVGTAYAVFTGIGAAGTGLLGIVLFDEPATAMRLFSLGVIVAGVTGLKVFAEDPAAAAESAEHR
jgi:quaternary ammonium compound-resistance protein SugE